MNRNSIIFTITTTFVIALLLMIVSFTIFYQVSERRAEFSLIKRDREVTRIFLRAFEHRGLTQELKENLKKDIHIPIDGGENNQTIGTLSLILSIQHILFNHS